MDSLPLTTSLSQPYRHTELLLVSPDGSHIDEWAEWIGKLMPGAALNIAKGLEQAHQLVPALARPPRLLLVHAHAAEVVEQSFEFLSDLHTAHPKTVALLLAEESLKDQLERIAGGEWIDTLWLPCTEAQFDVALREMRHRMTPGGQGRFEGYFRNLRVLDILQLKCARRDSCVLEFDTHSGNVGRVWIEQGQIRHAEAGGLTGISALALLLNSRGGIVSEEPYDPPKGWMSIDGTWDAALLNAVQAVDEAYGASLEPNEEDVVAPPEVAESVRPNLDPDRASSLIEGRHRILIADDSPLMLQFMQEIVWRAYPGVAIISLETGAEVVPTARQYQPDAIILDYFMPDFTGDDVAHDLLLFEETKDVPVILISGQLTDLSNLSREYPNIQAFLRKPFFPPQIISALHAAAPQLEKVADE